MTDKQKIFCELYAANPDATFAAVGAGYSKRTARSIGSENLTKPDIIEYIKELQQPDHDARIATIDEIQQFWTSTMRDDTLPLRDRLKASELHAKASGAFLHIDATDEVASGEIDGEDVVFYIPDNHRRIKSEDPEGQKESSAHMMG